jgi:hypothetical protein
MPLDVLRGGMIDILLKIDVAPVAAAADNTLMHLLLGAIHAVTSRVCVLTCTPNDPCDIHNSSALNNWPDVLTDHGYSRCRSRDF